MKKIHYHDVKGFIKDAESTVVLGLLVVCVRRVVRLGCFNDDEAMVRVLMTHVRDERSKMKDTTRRRKRR